MTNGITGLDHIVIAVADLEAARKIYQRLGFQVTPRGRHTGMSTGNYCVMFGQTYIELLGVVDPSLPVPDFAPKNAEDEGATAFVLANDDPDEVLAGLEASGIANGGKMDLKRDLELADQTVEPEFINIFVPPEHTPAVPVFFCHHLSPELTRHSPGWMLHVNGARMITDLYIVLEDNDAARANAEALFGTLNDEKDGFSARLGKQIIHFGSAGSIADIFPSVSAESLKSAPFIAGMTIEVGEPDAAMSIIDMAGITVHEGDNCVVISPDDACGVAVRLEGL